MFSCEYCETLKTGFFYRTPDSFRYKIDVFHIPCAIALFSFITIRISISWLFRTCFHTKIVTLVKCNLRTHYNVGSSTILVE